MLIKHEENIALMYKTQPQICFVGLLKLRLTEKRDNMENSSIYFISCNDIGAIYAQNYENIIKTFIQ